jgi:hypothetical protein
MPTLSAAGVSKFLHTLEQQQLQSKPATVKRTPQPPPPPPPLPGGTGAAREPPSAVNGGGGGESNGSGSFLEQLKQVLTYFAVFFIYFLLEP